MRDGTAYLRSNGTGHEGGSIEVRTERAMPFAAAGALAPTRGREKKDLEDFSPHMILDHAGHLKDLC